MGGIKIILDTAHAELIPNGQDLTPQQVKESYSNAVVNLWTTLQAELAVWDVQDSQLLTPDGFGAKTAKSIVSRLLPKITFEIRHASVDVCGVFTIRADNLRLADGDPDPLSGVEITDYKVGFVQGSGVLRKSFIIEGFRVACGDTPILEPTDFEMALAAHLIPDRVSNRLDASLSLRFSYLEIHAATSVLTPKLEELARRMEAGRVDLLKTRAQVDAELQELRERDASFPKIEDKARALAAYARILSHHSDASAYQDPEYVRENPETLTWLENFELLLGYAEIEAMVHTAMAQHVQKRRAETLARSATLPSDASGKKNSSSSSSSSSALMVNGLVDSRENLGAVFHALDADGSGYLDSFELARGLAAVGVKLGKTALDELLRQADVDGDGRVSREEFEHLYDVLVNQSGRVEERTKSFAFGPMVALGLSIQGIRVSWYPRGVAPTSAAPARPSLLTCVEGLGLHVLFMGSPVMDFDWFNAKKRVRLEVSSMYVGARYEETQDAMESVMGRDAMASETKTRGSSERVQTSVRVTLEELIWYRNAEDEAEKNDSLALLQLSLDPDAEDFTPSFRGQVASETSEQVVLTMDRKATLERRFFLESEDQINTVRVRVRASLAPKSKDHLWNRLLRDTPEKHAKFVGQGSWDVTIPTKRRIRFSSRAALTEHADVWCTISSARAPLGQVLMRIRTETTMSPSSHPLAAPASLLNRLLGSTDPRKEEAEQEEEAAAEEEPVMSVTCALHPFAGTTDVAVKVSMDFQRVSLSLESKLLRVWSKAQPVVSAGAASETSQATETPPVQEDVLTRPGDVFGFSTIPKPGRFLRLSIREDSESESAESVRVSVLEGEEPQRVDEGREATFGPFRRFQEVRSSLVTVSVVSSEEMELGKAYVSVSSLIEPFDVSDDDAETTRTPKVTRVVVALSAGIERAVSLEAVWVRERFAQTRDNSAPPTLWRATVWATLRLPEIRLPSRLLVKAHESTHAYVSLNQGASYALLRALRMVDQTVTGETRVPGRPDDDDDDDDDARTFITTKQEDNEDEDETNHSSSSPARRLPATPARHQLMDGFTWTLESHVSPLMLSVTSESLALDARLSCFGPLQLVGRLQIDPATRLGEVDAQLKLHHLMCLVDLGRGESRTLMDSSPLELRVAHVEDATDVSLRFNGLTLHATRLKDFADKLTSVMHQLTPEEEEKEEEEAEEEAASSPSPAAPPPAKASETMVIPTKSFRMEISIRELLLLVSTSLESPLDRTLRLTTGVDLTWTGEAFEDASREALAQKSPSAELVVGKLSTELALLNQGHVTVLVESFDVDLRSETFYVYNNQADSESEPGATTSTATAVSTQLRGEPVKQDLESVVQLAASNILSDANNQTLSSSNPSTRRVQRTASFSLLSRDRFQGFRVSDASDVLSWRDTHRGLFRRLQLSVKNMDVEMDADDLRFMLNVSTTLSGPNPYEPRPERAPEETTPEELYRAQQQHETPESTEPVLATTTTSETSSSAEQPSVATDPGDLFWTRAVFGDLLCFTSRPRELVGFSRGTIEDVRELVVTKTASTLSCLVPSNDVVSITLADFLWGLGLTSNKNGYAVPFMRFVLTKLVLESTYSKETRDVQGFVTFSSFAFNTRANQANHAWEPLSEPWTVRVSSVIAPNARTFARVMANYRWNLVLTDSFLFGLSKFTETLTDDTILLRDKDHRLASLEYCPLMVLNETGQTLHLAPVRDPDAAPEAETSSWIAVESDAARPIHVNDKRKLLDACRKIVSEFRTTQQRFLTKAMQAAKRRHESAPLDTEETMKRLSTDEGALDMIFRRIDTDGSNELDSSEIQRALAQMHELLTRSEILYEMGLIDEKGVENGVAHDVTINREEFVRFFVSESTRTMSKVRALRVALSPEGGSSTLAPIERSALDTSLQHHEDLICSVKSMGRSSLTTLVKFETSLRCENHTTESMEVLVESTKDVVCVLAPGESKCVPLSLLSDKTSMTSLAIRPTRLNREFGASQAFVRLHEPAVFVSEEKMHRMSCLPNPGAVLKPESPTSFECAVVETSQRLSSFKFRPTLHVQVLRAFGLLSADWNGLSDPYVSITAGPQKFKTKYIRKTLDPVWTDGSVFRVTSSESSPFPTSLEISVKDYDDLSANDLIGQLSVALTPEFLSECSTKPITRTFHLTPPPTHRKAKSAGKLVLSLFYEAFGVQADPSPRFQRVFMIQPSYVLENLLPFAVAVRIGDHPRIYRLSAGRRVSGYAPIKDQRDDQLESQALVMGLSDAEDVNALSDEDLRASPDWISAQPLQTHFTIRFHKSTSQRRASIRVINVKDADKNEDEDDANNPLGGVRRLIFYSDVWLVNQTGNPLTLSTKLDPPAAEPAFRLPSSFSKGVNANGTHKRHNAFLALCPTPKPIQDDADPMNVLIGMEMEARGDQVVKTIPFYSIGTKAVVRKKPALVNLNDEELTVGKILPLRSFLPNAVEYKPDPDGGVTGVLLILLHASCFQRVNVKHVAVNCRPSAATPEAAARKTVRVSPAGVPQGWMIHLQPWMRSESSPFELEFHYEPRNASPASSSLLKAKLLVPKSQLDSLDAHYESLALVSPSESRLLVHASSAALTELHTTMRETEFVVSCFACGAPSVGVPEPLIGSSSLGLSHQTSVMCTTTPLTGKHFRTRIVALAPRYFLACEDPHLRILCKPAGSPDCEARILTTTPRAMQVWQTTSLSYASPLVDNHVQLKCADHPGAAWTDPIPMDRDTCVQLRDSTGARVLRVVFDANMLGYSRCLVIRVSPPETTRTLIRNRSARAIRYQQHAQRATLGCCAPRGAKTAPATNPTSEPIPPDALEVLEPGKVLLFALDRFEELTALSRQANASDASTLAADEELTNINAASPSVFVEEIGVVKLVKGNVKKGKALAARVVSFGAKLVLDVVDLPTYRAELSAWKQKRVLRRQRLQAQAGPADPKPRSSQDDEDDEEEEESKVATQGQDAVEACVHFAGVGVSLVSSKRRSETAYCTLQRLHAEVALQTKSLPEAFEIVPRKTKTKWSFTSVDLSVGHLQIDSSQVNATYRVAATSLTTTKRRTLYQLVTGKKSPESTEDGHDAVLSTEMMRWCGTTASPEERAKRAAKDAIRIVLVTSAPVHRPQAQIIRTLSVSAKPLDLRLDGVFLAGVLSVLAPLRFGDEENDWINISSGGKKEAILAPELVALLSKDDLELPPPDSSLIQFAEFSALKFRISVQLATKDELHELAERFGVSSTALSFLSRLLRLNGFDFDLPRVVDGEVSTSRLQSEYVSTVVRAVLRQLTELLFNRVVGSKTSGSKQFDRIRLPLITQEGVVSGPYGPGAVPWADEAVIEARAVARIERFWYERKIKRAAAKLMEAEAAQAVAAQAEEERAQKERREAKSRGFFARLLGKS